MCAAVGNVLDECDRTSGGDLFESRIKNEGKKSGQGISLECMEKQIRKKRKESYNFEPRAPRANIVVRVREMKTPKSTVK